MHSLVTPSDGDFTADPVGMETSDMIQHETMPEEAAVEDR